MTGSFIAVVGATGTGKTAHSLRIAHQLDKAEIVNADAMQFYRGMNIGTAKLAPEEREGIPHHFFDVLGPAEEATVAWYQPAARDLIRERLERGISIILVGGSGLYVSSVLYDFDFPPRDDALRAQLQQELDTFGVEQLQRKLKQVDPATARHIDLNNPRRVIRALELHALGAPMRANLPPKPSLWWEKSRIVGVHVPREQLVERLDERVHRMWKEGLVEEVRSLIPHGIETGPTASRAIGYAQALAYLKGDITRAQAIEQTQLLTRRYARRQVSWFKRYEHIEWIDG